MILVKKRMTIIQEEMGDECYFDYDEEVVNQEKEFRHFFRDDRAILLKYCEDSSGFPQGIATVRKVSDDHIFVYQVLVDDPSRKMEITEILLKHIRVLYPNEISYGLLHKTNEKMKAYLKSIGSTQVEMLFQDEHPSATKDGGFIAFVHVSQLS